VSTGLAPHLRVGDVQANGSVWTYRHHGGGVAFAESGGGRVVAGLREVLDSLLSTNEIARDGVGFRLVREAARPTPSDEADGGR
jgi:hypothetical protein